MTTAMDAQHQVKLLAGLQQQRIAAALHDDVGQTLFALEVAARRAAQLTRARDVDADLAAAIAGIEQLARQATGELRGVLTGLTPSEPLERLPVAAKRDLDEFSTRSGVAAQLLLASDPAPVPSQVERAALACLRQALFNIERHSRASLVVVTLEFGSRELSVIVQDDGVGLPAGFTLSAVPSDGHCWGSAAMLRQVEQLGGALELTTGEEGGVRLHARLPVPQ